MLRVRLLHGGALVVAQAGAGEETHQVVEGISTLHPQPLSLLGRGEWRSPPAKRGDAPREGGVLHQTQLHQPAQVRVAFIVAHGFFGLGVEAGGENAEAGEDALLASGQRRITQIQRGFHIQVARRVEADALQALAFIAQLLHVRHRIEIDRFGQQAGAGAQRLRQIAAQVRDEIGHPNRRHSPVRHSESRRDEESLAD